MPLTLNPKPIPGPMATPNNSHTVVIHGVTVTVTTK